MRMWKYEVSNDWRSHKQKNLFNNTKNKPLEDDMSNSIKFKKSVNISLIAIEIEQLSLLFTLQAVKQ